MRPPPCLQLAVISAAVLSLTPVCAFSAEAPDTYVAAALREDFDALYAGLKASHFDLYARRSKPAYDALHRTMRRAFQAPLDRTEAEIRFQKFAAFGDVAHANIAFPSAAYEAYRAGGGKAFPLGIRFVGDRLMIAEDMSGADPSLVGSRILSVNGVDARVLENRLAAHLLADNPYLSRTMLEFRFAPLLWVELGAIDAFVIAVETEEGARQTVRVPALPRERLVLSDAVFALDWNERRHAVMDDIGYLRPGPFYNNAPDAADIWDAAAFKTFVDAAFAEFIARNVPAVLIDLRSNPGGDNSFSDHMVAWFADRPFRFASHFYVKVSEAAIASNARRLQPGDASSISARFAAAYAKADIGDVIDFDLGAALRATGSSIVGKSSS